MGRNCHGPKLTWADFVMGRNDPEPPEVTRPTSDINICCCIFQFWHDRIKSEVGTKKNEPKKGHGGKHTQPKRWTGAPANWENN